ncbi:nucleoside-diphosphate-sugar epimerase [Azospirillum lipoferum]|uniref:NAD-dependent epimerase/dehydratase family protein n=1 Tax=Azospirillum lipoferum TaxID=193 RepID=A0A5A9GM33_AZOLI|nr:MULTISPECIES: SDR family oxidoreductase [Azospirillum]KAA0595397.1 NAD-dependent epimerase/dehydratase family protein [Azospirillum lipoferum]MCP1611703.1 nucleoside-diphosphate-sugar epimerase [Azospirillum lipoferum]MDW5533538.1 SDR family oxidoreductase [Azospirillum sp. NL1]
MTTVLLTGATGFIGGAVLAHGLGSHPEARPETRWICLVRGSNAARARARLLENLSRFMAAEAAREAIGRVEIVVGDITAPPSLEDRRLDAVTHILHLAADTSFRAQEHCHRVNVEGTRALAERARRMPNLCRFLYGGTAMICGGNPPPLVREADAPAPAAEHIVPYTRTKAATEAMLRHEFADLPAVMVRPSIVTGHRTLGCIPSSSIFWMFRAGDRLRLVAGDLDGGIDVVPVDWTAEVLVGLMLKPELAYDSYHLSAGLRKRTRWSDLAAAFERCDPQGGPRDYSRFDAGDWKILRARFEMAFGLGGPLQLAMLRAMRSYYQFSTLGVAFDNDRLAAEGFALPPTLAEYLPACLSAPSGLSIIDQFADDLGMFDGVPESLPKPVAA